MDQLRKGRTLPMGGPVDDECGATMVEYCFMAVLIAVVCVLAITAIGQATNAEFAAPDLLDALIP